ncbi:porin family protein [Pontibacter populi]|uniref:Porin family protein n=1 Tax=Pontibacter populi TaxID=890055 RepID=A0ABV1RTQ9_9BACT
MKKIFLLIAVVLGFAATKVNAQQAQPIRFGVKVGANLSNWQGETVNSAQNLIDLSDGNVNRKMREGVHAGLYISIPVGPGFEIEPGLQYSQKGTRLTGKLPWVETEFLNANMTITNKSEYIELPVLAKLYVAEGFHIFAGPQVAYLLSNKVQAQASVLGFNAFNREWDMKNGFREFDMSIVGGVGYKFANGLNLSAGYDHGLNTIDENANFETYNRTFKASVGYTF